MVAKTGRLGIFVIFLLLAAWQDFREKQVSVRLYQFFGVMAVMLLGVTLYEACLSAAFQEHEQTAIVELWVVAGRSQLLGILPGILLFLCARFSRGAVGIGDGCFFAISGLLLGLPDNCFLFFYALLSCGLFGLGYYVVGWIRKSGINGKTELPFLPFAVVPGLWIVAVRLVR